MFLSLVIHRGLIFMRDEIKRYIDLMLSEIESNITIMEVCGTHTVSISRAGIRGLVAPKIKLVSGPGCPVCVTDNRDLNKIFQLAEKDITILTFGDLMKVPCEGMSLYKKKAEGADIRVVYSPIDAFLFAKDNPSRRVVFIGIGFETTAPAIVGALHMAAQAELKNFYLLSILKTMPAPLRFVASHPKLKVDGFILPGHVSTIIGRRAYEFIGKEFGLPSVISGFEPQDILMNLRELSKLIIQRKSVVLNGYKRAVKEDGNPKARELIYKYLEPSDAYWRGIGKLEGSGLKLRSEYESYDAVVQFGLADKEVKEPKGCRCGEVILGSMEPFMCPFFGKACTPDNPIGPCMVSFEGTCAAYYKYGG